MKFTECLGKRLTLTLKSGLLGTVLWVPAAVLAQSPEAVHDDELIPIAIAVERQDTTASAATTAAAIPFENRTVSGETQRLVRPMMTTPVSPMPVPEPGETQETERRSSTTASAQQEKMHRLSGHLQNKYRLSPTKARHIVREAMENADRHRLEPELILAIIAVESTFQERAVSRVGARGLMQVMPQPHADKVQEIGGAHQLFDPAKNIHVGSRILVKYLNAHSGNLRCALLKYNGSLGSRSRFPDRVLQVYRDLKRITVEG